MIPMPLAFHFCTGQINEKNKAVPKESVSAQNNLKKSTKLIKLFQPDYKKKKKNISPFALNTQRSKTQINQQI